MREKSTFTRIALVIVGLFLLAFLFYPLLYSVRQAFTEFVNISCHFPSTPFIKSIDELNCMN